MQAKSIATMQLAFTGVEKAADGSPFVANYILQLSQFDESAATLARINEVKHLLQNPQSVEQAKQKLAQLRDENKIWFVIQPKVVEQQSPIALDPQEMQVADQSPTLKLQANVGSPKTDGEQPGMDQASQQQQ